MRKIFVALAAMALFVGAAERVQANETAVIYKDPNCGCCAGYAEHLRRNGFRVEVRDTAVLDAIKRKYSVPATLASCHTMRIGGYTVEGHVPVTTVRKLLRDKPKIAGIALPGMPQGSPGMPGPKEEPFVTYVLMPGKAKVFNVD